MKPGFFHRRVVAPIVALLTQGITPGKIALSLAFGITLGVFPVLGTTTLLCVAAALMFGLNLPAIQLVNWLIYPLQLILLLPFMRLGERSFRASPLQFSRAQIVAIAHGDLRHAVTSLWRVEAHAMLGWLLIGPPAILLLYFVLSRVLRQMASSGMRSVNAEIENGNVTNSVVAR
ncbi:MAG: DUF2062 domain-containing protein [Terriglobales bacterium]|jgi:uncharacterized protein (DUF2062 family)